MRLNANKFLSTFCLEFQVFDTRAEAMNREKYLKSGVGRDWIKLHFEI
jgi:hypothetical protein